MKNSLTPAFPVIIDFGMDDRQTDYGLTKREYFAIQIYAAWCSNSRLSAEWIEVSGPKEAIILADNLLSKLEG